MGGSVDTWRFHALAPLSSKHARTAGGIARGSCLPPLHLETFFPLVLLLSIYISGSVAHQRASQLQIYFSALAERERGRNVIAAHYVYMSQGSGCALSAQERAPYHCGTVQSALQIKHTLMRFALVL